MIISKAAHTTSSFKLLATHSHPTSTTGNPPKVVHERRDAVHREWKLVARASATAPLTLSIGLVQRNLERAEEFMKAVSHPDSDQYGQHWTAQKVVEVFSASDSAIADTKTWLLSEGVDAGRISTSAGRNWIKVASTVGEAATLLDATYGVYENDDGARIVACESYSVPAAIKAHIDFITPTIQFDSGMASTRGSVNRRRDAFAPKTKKLPPHQHPGVDSLKNCSEVTTPACLRALYGIPAKVEPVAGNSYGIVEFAPQSYNQHDLDGFFSAYGHLPNGTSPILNKIDGGFLSDEAGSGIRGESNLDLCYAIALTYPQNVTLYQVGDSVAWNPATNNNFLDAIDGSYCTAGGGDDPLWDAAYPHDASTAGAYAGPPQCGVYNATKVLSISYGRDEAARPASYNARECMEYMKLGLMGVSVLFSSGDTGVSGVTGHCLNPDGSYAPVWADWGRFNPLFPGTCPWVTSVGGSALPPNGTVGRDREVVAYAFAPSGGFSNVFARPAYQAAALATYYARHDPGYNASRYNDTRHVRGFPDLALAAQDYVTGLDGGFQAFSGTSASSPAFGAMVALLNGERIKAGKAPVGFLNPVLYAHPEMFVDVVEGSIGGCGTPGFSAVAGWDPASGLGTPSFERMRRVFMKLP
ncbi:peptidase S8/S53 domain-containing protein [Podospora appendiculata]|uniref:Peptidase S8/S53 domain-containing protein n=1 Tax=Podospora appendiculata TaxID=314037 RepID=A0AAE0XJP8_9PEZI|nr:peptidase S8/S53 domain-containing protein [Podospora appendiculata]